MFEISAENTGRTIAKIKGGVNNDQYVKYIDKKAGDTVEGINEVVLTDGQFEPCPMISRERDIMYMAGPSGSGKSYYTKMYMLNYIKAHPTNEIYIFSKLGEDVSLDDVPDLRRVKIDNRLMTQPFEVDDFKNSLVVLDDIDCLTNKEHKEALNDLKIGILETGRHTNTSMLITSHIVCKGNETKTILSESQYITIYPSSGMPLNTLLSGYMGLTTKQIRTIKALPSRWVTIVKNYPQMIMSETKLFFMKDL
jgi:hypothetical protein